MLRVTKPVFLSTSRLKRGSSYGLGTCSTWFEVNAAPTIPAAAGTRIVPDEPNAADRRDDAIAVVRRLRDAGHTAYFAGGCVRDTLLGLQPKDYDVATDAQPQRVRQLFNNTQAVGAAFGVILVRQRK